MDEIKDYFIQKLLKDSELHRVVKEYLSNGSINICLKTQDGRVVNANISGGINLNSNELKTLRGGDTWPKK